VVGEGEPRRVVVGRIAAAHGLRGVVRVRVLGDDARLLLSLEELESSHAERPELDPRSRPRRVEWSAAGRPGEVRLKLQGVEDRDAAQALRGDFLLTSSAALAPLPQGEHYWYELVGCRVEDAAGNPLGKVRELWETPAHDVLVVEDAAGKEHLIPAVDAFLEEVDIEAGRIRVATIPGLIDP
jgi:16S rRNA processing protein RimM